MTRLYGWGPTHQRVEYSVPHGHWKTTTFVAAFRLDGLFAPLVVDGAMTGDLFVKYIQQELAPQLRSGDILILDNLPTHKVKGVAEAVQTRDATVVYLPPYSPDFNPIEQVFSKIKNDCDAGNTARLPNWRTRSESHSTGSPSRMHYTTFRTQDTRRNEIESALGMRSALLARVGLVTATPFSYFAR